MDFPASWIFISFAIFGTHLGFLLCLGQCILERKTSLNRLLAILFISLGILQGTGLCLVLGFHSFLPKIIILHIPVLATVGPVLYGIHKIIQDSEFETSLFGLDGKHFFLPGLFWVWYANILLTGNRELSDSIEVFISENSLLDFVFYIPLLILGAYIAALLRGSRMLFKPSVLREEWTARVLLYIILATITNHTVGALYLFHKNPIFLLASADMMALSLCIAYLIGRRYPAYFQNLQEVARETLRKYNRSLLIGMDLETLRNNLTLSMEKEKLYKEEDLNLANLAEELGLTPHQLSELINKEMGKNFSIFVNEYRIKEACELLQSEPQRSILDIGYEVGFRSKTAFLRAFLKQTGLTPSEYREKNSIR
ncbi:AraC family transcriptional regulator [Leptospira kobayashii]|uniref:AraC family transcriptional regulator n=1 Tax=Leptospira kobayashii TaxID=1917830 RepID=UPI000D59D41F|nr:helix-turn-helix domain-containing protein [Leptospira kobayashii]